MKIFDCFTFYNEFDILELRLQELWDTVDTFIIAEANIHIKIIQKIFILKITGKDLNLTKVKFDT